jgi:FlaA1/EpsC-like NDP-sugar epimerase
MDMSGAGALDFKRFLPPFDDGPANSPFASMLSGRSVLVTGAGGFIGSALVRAIAAAAPARIILLDSCEYNLFRIAGQLDVEQEAILGSVTDAALLDGILERFRPEIIYHAAAFKHVALLESNAAAAVRNNTIGTYRLAQAALRHGVGRLVLLSTDKAVYPESVLGMTKRLAELAGVALSSAACRMNAVRFGNVIGSTGSVVPLFLDEIAAKRAVTVTHPDVCRYFLSVGEAVDALLAAVAADCHARILLPEPHAPVRIRDLAQYLIDVKGNGNVIRYTGLQSGEKMSEDLTFRHEVQEGLTGPLRIYHTCAPRPDELAGLMDQLETQDASQLIRTMRAAVAA